MLRSFALYALLRSRRSQTPTSSVLPTSQTMLTATQATSRIPSQDIVQQQQLSVQHSPLTCFTATLLGAAFSLHFTNAHAYSTAPKVGQTADSSHAPGHMQAGMPAAQANSADSEQAAARQIMQQMSLAMQRKDYETAQRLFDLELALQVCLPSCLSHHNMGKGMA